MGHRRPLASCNTSTHHSTASAASCSACSSSLESSPTSPGDSTSASTPTLTYQTEYNNCSPWVPDSHSSNTYSHLSDSHPPDSHLAIADSLLSLKAALAHPHPSRPRHKLHLHQPHHPPHSVQHKIVKMSRPIVSSPSPDSIRRMPLSRPPDPNRPLLHRTTSSSTLTSTPSSSTSHSRSNSVVDLAHHLPSLPTASSSTVSSPSSSPLHRSDDITRISNLLNQVNHTDQTNQSQLNQANHPDPNHPNQSNQSDQANQSDQSNLSNGESGPVRSICTSPLPINVTDDPESLITKDVVSLFQYSLNKFLLSLRAMNIEPPDDVTRHVISSVDSNQTSPPTPSSAPSPPPIPNQTTKYGQNVNIYVKVAKYIRDTMPTTSDHHLPSPQSPPMSAQRQVNLTPQEILIFAAMGTDTTNIDNMEQLLHPVSKVNLPSLTPPLPDAAMVPVSFPIIAKLRLQLAQISPHTTPDTHQTLCHALDVLDDSIRQSIKLTSPVPLFKKIWFVDDRIHQLLKNRNFFALRILFVFSCLCIMTRLPFMNEINVWCDYIEWFINFSLAMNERDAVHRGFRKFDDCLYKWVVLRKCKLHPGKLHKLAAFDPELDQVL